MSHIDSFFLIYLIKYENNVLHFLISGQEMVTNESILLITRLKNLLNKNVFAALSV